MKILLVKPWLDSFNWYHSHMLGLAYVAGYIRTKGHTVDILDASFLRLDEKVAHLPTRAAHRRAQRRDLPPRA